MSSKRITKKKAKLKKADPGSAGVSPAVRAQDRSRKGDKPAAKPELSVPARLAGSHPLYDPARFMATMLPHHARHSGNPMHAYSFEQYRAQHAKALPNRPGKRLAIAAPRGAAKSTVHTLLFPLMDLLLGRERHQVIISGTMQQAKNRLATIVHELRTNVQIRDVFFGGKAPRIKNNCRSVQVGDCLIEAFSAGSEMRGISHGEYRPTRIILDDVEHSRNATKAYHRRKILTWYDEVVENLGDTYTHITIVGTIIHTDGLLATLLARPGYRSQLYKSIIEWDNEPDLWREWQRIYVDRANPDAVEDADAFFAEHEARMTAGTQVFWPEKEPYLKLQKDLLTFGRAAFFKEKQNTPIKDGSQIFDTTLWKRFISPEGFIEPVQNSLTLEEESTLPDGTALRGRPSWGSVLPGAPVAPPTKTADLKYYGFLDPAMGKTGGAREGDFASIVTVGAAADGTQYVVDVWMERASLHRQVEHIFALQQRFNYERFGFESNGFQEAIGSMIKEHQEKLRRAGAPWRLPLEPHNNSHSKHARISLLEPRILSGQIQFNQDLPQQFYMQADEYNGSTRGHDDALDALASCTEMIQRHSAPRRQIKTIPRPAGWRH